MSKQRVRVPPKCGPDWTTAERNALAAWMAKITMERIEQDATEMPVLAKVPMYHLLRGIHFVLTKPEHLLEENRESLEKPYDPSQNYNLVFLVGDPAKLKEAMGG